MAGSIDSLRLLVVVNHIQLPRQSYDTTAGKLEKFEVGGVQLCPRGRS